MYSRNYVQNDLYYYIKKYKIHKFSDELWSFKGTIQFCALVDNSGSTNFFFDNHKKEDTIYEKISNYLIDFFDFLKMIDNDGLNISFLNKKNNNNKNILNINNKDVLKKVLNDNAPTNKRSSLLRSFNKIIKHYESIEGKPVAILIWTDGEPCDCNITQFIDVVKSTLNKYRNISVNIIIITKDNDINKLYENIDNGKTERFNIVLNADIEEIKVIKSNKFYGTFSDSVYMLMTTLGGHCKKIGSLNKIKEMEKDEAIACFLLLLLFSMPFVTLYCIYLFLLHFEIIIYQ